MLRALDEAVAAAVASIPPEHRTLLTYHDSWAYFASRYEIDVIGAIQPADFSEPSAADVRRMVDQVRSEQVPAVFGAEEMMVENVRIIVEALGGDPSALDKVTA